MGRRQTTPGPEDRPPARALAEERREQNPAGASDAFFGKRASQLDDWLRIEQDGTITAFSGKVELGTGVRTALAQIVAEELDVPFERVRMVMGDTGQTPDEGYTAGSMTVHMGGTALRNAAAEARRALLEAASERLDAAVDELIVRDGVVTVGHHPDRSVTYAELMGGQRFQREVSGQAPLKRPQDYRVVGTAVPRADLPAKLAGQPSFVHDVRRPGMLHGRVVPPPGPGAQLESLDEESLRDVPGMVRVVRRGNFVGVVAEREEQAVRAARQLKLVWREASSLPPMETQFNQLRDQAVREDILVQAGDADRALRGAAHRLSAMYCQPYHAHAALGPSCAVAEVNGDQVTVWASTQGPYPLRGALAQLLQLPPENVRLIHVEGAGCYGQNGADDVAAEALLLSQAVGRPVRVQWSREQEFAWEPKAAPMVMELRGGLDAQGKIVAWQSDVWSPTHGARPRFAAQLLAAQWSSGQDAPPARFFIGAERNAPTNYAVPNQMIRVHWLARTPLRVSSFRSLGGTANTFANESFMDELAAAAGADPVQFRLRHLETPRARAVLEAAAAKAGWGSPAAAGELPPGWDYGRGAAFAQYENSEACVATVAEVLVQPASGAVQVKRIVVAHDCGLIINPDGLTNQIEGNVIQSLSRALKEEVKFDRSRITSVDWESYPILKFSEIPEIEVVLLDRPDQPALGAGEASTITTAPAVANAIFDACGARLRQPPFTPERVKALLA